MLLLICLFQSAALRVRSDFCLFGENKLWKMCTSEDHSVLWYLIPCLFIGFDSCSLLVYSYQQLWLKKKKTKPLGRYPWVLSTLSQSFNRFAQLCSSVSCEFPQVPPHHHCLNLCSHYFLPRPLQSSLNCSFSPQVMCIISTKVNFFVITNILLVCLYICVSLCLGIYKVVVLCVMK